MSVLFHTTSNSVSLRAWVIKEGSTAVSGISFQAAGTEYSLEGLMLKLKLQHFGHLMQRANSLEKTLMLGKTEGRRRRGRQRIRWLNSITDLMDMNLSKLQEIVEEPGMQQSMGLQRVNTTS